MLIRANYNPADIPRNEKVSPHSLSPCKMPILLLFNLSFTKIHCFMGVVVVIIQIL